MPFTPENYRKIANSPEPGELALPQSWKKYENLAAMLIHGEDFPSPTNRITLHAQRKDQYGIPVPVVNYEHHPKLHKDTRLCAE